MVIGIDASRANQKGKTGVGWYSYHLIQELKKTPLKPGDEFILYSFDELKEDLAQLPEKWQSRKLSWPLRYLWTQIRLSWEMFLNPPDILFVPAHCLPLVCGAKSVITVHDLGFKRFKKAYSLGQRLYTSFVYWWAVKYADKIIVPSEFTKKELTELYAVKKEKITVIHEGYDKEKFHLMRDREKTNLVLGKYGIERPYFLYVGRLETKKNTEGLIKAYNKMCTLNSNVPQLVLVGSPGYGYEKIKKFIPPASGEEGKSNIKEIGYVEGDDLIFLYSGAEAFIFPSFYEGFGLPVLEAMACGCPVLTSNAGSIPEVGGQAALYFSPNNTDELIKAMKKIAEDKGLKEELKEKGLERIKDFPWEKCARETIEIFHSIK